jgi:hypothetical protein
MNQAIEHVRFWPITNIAVYWFDSFLGTKRARDGTPANLPWLGPVFHSLADATVPYHASGLSGCGHGAYEDVVEQLGRSGKLYDRAIVTRHMNAQHLHARTKVAEMVVGNAEAASDPAYCICSPSACDCPVVRNQTAAKDLYNLAVASTAVALRKALQAWRAQGTRMKAEGVPTPPIVTVEPAKAFSRFQDTPVSPLRIVGADREAAQNFEASLSRTLLDMKRAIARWEERQISRDAFRTEFDNAVLRVANVVERFPQLRWDPYSPEVGVVSFPGLPPLADPPIRFRLPTLDEINDGSAWDQYSAQRRRFFGAAGLYSAGELRSSLQAQLRRKMAIQDLDRIRERITHLRAAEDSYIAQGGEDSKQ